MWGVCYQVPQDSPPKEDSIWYVFRKGYFLSRASHLGTFLFLNQHVEMVATCCVSVFRDKARLTLRILYFFFF